MLSELNFMQIEPQILIANYLLPATLLLCGVLMLRHLFIEKRNLPPGPIGLPLVGYLPFLGEEPFKTLEKLRRKYGNVFSLYLGRQYVVVLGDYTAVKESFSQPATNNRPPKLFDIIPDGGGVSGVNGEEWVEQKRFMLKVMKDIGLGRTTWVRLVEEDVANFVRLIADEEGHPIYVRKLLTSSVPDSIMTLVFGRRLPEGTDRELVISATNTVARFFNQSDYWNFFPLLCQLLVKLKISRYYKDYCEMEAFNTLVRNEVELHKKSQSDSEKTDFISKYIADMEMSEGKERTFNARNLVANARSLVVGGIETVKTALLWLFLTMATYPDIQEKVHSELDSILGKEERASWEDRLKFPYTYAVILETQRWKTIVPLNVARMAAEDIKVCGYDIPKGTTITANIWGLHNDPSYWKEPEKFVPERFLKNGLSEIDLKKESFVSFSYGKRKCLGETIAMVEIFLYFTTVMQLFQVRAQGGRKPKMEAVLGVTYQPVPELLCFTSRT